MHGYHKERGLEGEGDKMLSTQNDSPQRESRGRAKQSQEKNRETGKEFTVSQCCYGYMLTSLELPKYGVQFSERMGGQDKE